VWRRSEQVLDKETLDGIIRKLMDIDAKLTRLLGDDEEDGDAEENGS
jgi:hypothetical protein